MLGLALAAALAAQTGGWTWTLYDNDGAIVLANEIPDTTRLRTVLACDAGAGVARVTVYGLTAAGNGFATLSSGEASAAVEAEGQSGAGGPRLSAPVRLDHPVFAAFQASGRLEVRSGDETRTVTMDPRHRPQLARFAALCGE